MIYKRACCAFVIFIAIAKYAGAQTVDMARGDLAMKNHDYKKALAIFKQAVTSDSSNIGYQEKLARVYMATGDYASAEALYARLAADPKADKVDKFYYGQALCDNGKYELAGKVFDAFVLAMPNDARAKEFKNFAGALPGMLHDKGIFDITHALKNSGGNDIGPTFCIYSLCFYSNRSRGAELKYHDDLSGKNLYNFYMLPGGNPEEAGLVKKIKGPVNSRLNNGPATFSHDGTEMIFARRNYHIKAIDGIVKLGLYHARFDSAKRKWVDIQPVNITNYNYNMAHPTLSKNGMQLFFVSDMPGGFGETDIYVSNKVGNQWSEPVNLGSDVNTPGNELFPFIADNGTLFFSSDTHIGLGGLDIYSAVSNNGHWGNVQNIGAPFNSRYDDFGYMSNEKQSGGYFVSNRPGGVNSEDIYKFVRKK